MTNEQDQSKLQIQPQQGWGCGRGGRQRSRGHGTRGRTARRALDKFRPTINAPLKVARDPGDPTTKEREDHNATHIPFRSWCPICVKATGREEAHKNGRGKERSCKATHFIRLQKLLAKRTIVMTRQQPLCTKTITPKCVFGHVCERRRDFG